MNGSTFSGGEPSGVVTTETLTAGHADTVNIAVADQLGEYDIYHAVHNGANEAPLDTSQGLVSAPGGQDANASEFVGAEVHGGFAGVSLCFRFSARSVNSHGALREVKLGFLFPARQAAFDGRTFLHPARTGF